MLFHIVEVEQIQQKILYVVAVRVTNQRDMNTGSYGIFNKIFMMRTILIE
tara:strand:- start:799 stop:948 length:150 start_codon:yes stop_codon:yes gene_type:complete